MGWRHTCQNADVRLHQDTMKTNAAYADLARLEEAVSDMKVVQHMQQEQIRTLEAQIQAQVRLWCVSVSVRTATHVSIFVIAPSYHLPRD